MKLTDILSPTCVKVPLQGADKTSAITELVDVLAAHDLGGDRDEMLRAVLERENTRSTGIGHGLAVPHGKCQGCQRLAMALGKPETPIDFGSRDGQPVNIIVLLVSPPTETGPHIEALARISRLMLMDDFRQAISGAATPEDIYAVIQDHEQ